jgi:hypothetical protein
VQLTDRDYVTHAHTPLAFLHATPRRLLLGGAGFILNSGSSITRPSSFIATDLNRTYSGFFFLCPALPMPDIQAAAQLPPSRSVPTPHSSPCTYRCTPRFCPLHTRDPRLLAVLCAPPSSPACALLLLHTRLLSLSPPGLSLRLWCKPASPRPAPARAVHVVLPVLAHSCAIRPDGTPVPTLLRTARSHSSLAPCAIRIVWPLCPPLYRCAYLPLPSLLGLLQTLSVALTCVLLSQHVSHPTSIQIMPPTVFLLSLALRLVLASARSSHLLDSAS